MGSDGSEKIRSDHRLRWYQRLAVWVVPPQWIVDLDDDPY